MKRMVKEEPEGAVPVDKKDLILPSLQVVLTVSHTKPF